MRSASDNLDRSFLTSLISFVGAFSLFLKKNLLARFLLLFSTFAVGTSSNLISKLQSEEAIGGAVHDVVIQHSPDVGVQNSLWIVEVVKH